MEIVQAGFKASHESIIQLIKAKAIREPIRLNGKREENNVGIKVNKATSTGFLVNKYCLILFFTYGPSNGFTSIIFLKASSLRGEFKIRCQSSSLM